MLAATPREAFFALGRFALADSQRASGSLNAGGCIEREGIAARFSDFVKREPATPGIAFLREALSFGGGELGFDVDAWVFELAGAVLGDTRSERMLPHCESAVQAFFAQCLCGTVPLHDRFDILATEGDGASLGYVAQTMVANRLLSAGDHVAIGGRPLLPDMELPDLSVYGLHTVDIFPAPAESGFPAAEIDKLLDPAIKAFFVVNPGDPKSADIDRVATIVRTQRPDLLVVADESIGTFVDGFRSFAAVLPASVLSTYSFSPLFGAAGWRLGIVALHPANAFDLALAELPDRVSRRLARRYAGVERRGVKLKFIDRIAAESRCVALPHAAGLSAPQQAQATLFALFLLVDAGRPFIEHTASVAAENLSALRHGLGVPPTHGPDANPYQAVVDIISVARDRHGHVFACWLLNRGDPSGFIQSLGCAATAVPVRTAHDSRWTVRISLADRPRQDYAALGERIVRLVDVAYDEFTMAASTARRSPPERPAKHRANSR